MVNEKQIVDIEEKNIYAVLCYIGILIVVPLIVKKNDPYVNWHIRQGLVVLTIIVFSLIASAWMERTGNLMFLLIITVDLIAAVQALIGRRWKIPLLGDIANKFSM